MKSSFFDRMKSHVGNLIQLKTHFITSGNQENSTVKKARGDIFLLSYVYSSSREARSTSIPDRGYWSELLPAWELSTDWNPLAERQSVYASLLIDSSCKVVLLTEDSVKLL